MLDDGAQPCGAGVGGNVTPYRPVETRGFGELPFILQGDPVGVRNVLPVDVDLGEAKMLGRIDLTWRGNGGSEAYFQYKLYGSADNVAFTELADRSTNEDLGFTSDYVRNTTAYRYIRITISRYVNFTNGNAPGYNPGLYEIKVYS